MRRSESSGVRGAGSRSALVLLALVMVATSASCRRQESSGNEVPAKTSGRSELWTYPDEQFDDPEIRREPRVQFVWRAPDELRDSIWSINLAGSDIRRVAGPELVYGSGIQTLSDIPVRSPDRRYIACVGDNASGDQVRYLIDLKARTVRIMKEAAGIAYFNWTPDSRHVLFYGDIKLWKYEVETGSVTEEPMIYSRGLYLVRGGFIAVRVGEIAFYSREGKLQRSVAHPYKNISEHRLSGDETLLMLETPTETVVVRHDDLANPLYRGESRLHHGDFGPDGSVIYFFYEGRFNVLDLGTGEVRKLYDLPGSRIPAQATLIGALNR